MSLRENKISKTLKPLFLYERGRLYLLFLFILIFQSVSAQIYVTEGTTITINSENAVFYSSDATEIKTIEVKNPTPAKVYVSSGTNITPTEDQSFEIVKIDKPKKNQHKLYAKKEPEKILTKKKIHHQTVEKVPQKQVLISSAPAKSSFLFSEVSRLDGAVVSGNHNHSKTAVSSVQNNLFTNNLRLRESSNNFLHQNFLVPTSYFTSFSVRPPPFS